MSDIFISYAREDVEHARRLRESLTAKGWSVFWDRRIPPGRSFEEIIEEQIRDCRAMVVIWSRNSATSKWVKIEAAIGRDRDILVPVLVEQAVIPFGYGHLQAADLTEWRAADSAPEFDDLVASIERLAPRPVDLPASGPPPAGKFPVDETASPATPPEDIDVGKEIRPAPSSVRIDAGESAAGTALLEKMSPEAHSFSHPSLVTPPTASDGVASDGTNERDGANRRPRLILAVVGGILVVATGTYYFARPDPASHTASVPNRPAGESGGDIMKRPPDVSNIVTPPAQTDEKAPAKKEPKGAKARQLESASRIRHTPQAMNVAQVMAALKAGDLFDNRWNVRGGFAHSFQKCLAGSIDLIYDATSGLLWGRPIERDLSVSEANAEVGRLNAQRYGERSDWRLPTLDELSTLLEARAMDGEPCMRPEGVMDSPDFHRTCIDPIFGFKNIKAQQPFFWTSDPARVQGEGVGTNWGVMFMSNEPQHYGKWGTAGVFPVAIESARPAGCSSVR